MGCVILIMGLPGSGKTTLAAELSWRLKATHWNADWVRQNINYHLGFSEDDRLKQAWSMGMLARRSAVHGCASVADFVCPTPGTRESFGYRDFTVWMNTGKPCVYPDTAALFVPPDDADLTVTDWNTEETVRTILSRLCLG